jgi:hypothetical protein
MRFTLLNALRTDIITNSVNVLRDFQNVVLAAN